MLAGHGRATQARDSRRRRQVRRVVRQRRLQRAADPQGVGSTEGMGICHTYTPDGRCVSLLKVLFTNICIYDCRYCTSRISSDVERARFLVDEVVDLTLGFYRRNYIEGLFLSSGVLKSPDYTMEQLILVARTLRETHRFGGYIHLKAAPGVSAELLQQAGRFADRLSVNVELPTQADLDTLAPQKSMAAVEASMSAIANAQEAAPTPSAFAPAGRAPRSSWAPPRPPTPTSSGTSQRLYQAHQLRRVYYSAFSPIAHGDPRLPPVPPPLMREHRLYQADWLLRFYGFAVDELVSHATPHLDLTVDPKLAWALAHREFFPVDLNQGEREALLRVPGLGRETVHKIVLARRTRGLRRHDLSKLGVARRAAPFLLTADDVSTAARTLDRQDLAERVLPAVQLGLFEARQSAVRGQL